MNPNSMIFKETNKAFSDFDRNDHSPAVINNKLEALKVLANSILLEVVTLEKNKEIKAENKIDLSIEVERFETDLIRCALVRTGGRQRQAARLLNVKPTTLHAKMKRYGLIEI